MGRKDRRTTSKVRFKLLTPFGIEALREATEESPLIHEKKYREAMRQRIKMITGRSYDGQLCAAAQGNQLFCVVKLEGKHIRALIDSGATGNFLDPRVVAENEYTAQRKKHPYRLTLVDGENTDYNDGWVNRETTELTMVMARGHKESIQFDITAIGHHQAILGMPWLKQHNPRIDWLNETIILDQCDCKTTTPRLKRENASLGQEEICANSQEPEYLAQDSLLKNIPIVYKDFKELFLEEKGIEALPAHQPWDHSIPIEPGKDVPFGPIYQMSEKELQVLREYIDTNLKKGFIRESQSPAGSPVLFVPKPNGKLRLCVDYRLLNNVTIKDRYAIPLTHELQDRTNGAVIYTKMDLRGAFNLIRIKEGEEWKTAFRTRYGHYEYCVMPFGLTNAPATFQRMINNVLREYLDVFVIVYLDDILVYSKNVKDHVTHVRKVLQKLQEHHLQVDPEKCVFHTKKVEFLGYIITTEGVEMSKEKVKAVLDWPTPTSVKTVQSFLGFANYYRKFIKGYGGVAAPLTELTKKDQEFEWTEKAQHAFDTLKKQFTEEPVLRSFNPNKEIVLETDASDYAIGACLGQPGQDDKVQPVAYYSRKMTPAELNYDVHDKELLAIVEAFSHWRAYLEGSKYVVQVYTDHKNLIYFTTTKKLTRRQVRWSEELSAYDFRITYRKGSENGRADALSRQTEYEGYKVERERAILKQGPDGLVYNHELATIAVIEDNTWENKLKEAYEKDEISKQQTQQISGSFSKDNQGILRFKGLVYVPTTLRKEFVREQHSLPAHGHQGVKRTFERMSRDYYFPGMRKAIETEIMECNECNKSKATHHAPYGLLKSPKVADKAWKSVAMDFIVKLPPSREPLTNIRYDAILVITCRNSKYGYFIPYKEGSTANDFAYAFLRTIIANHGLPEEIISDRDKLWTSKFWTTLMAQLGANHKLSTAYHPQTDGQTERLNQTLEAYLRMYVNYDQDNWVEKLPLAQFAYNSSISEPLGTSPFYANYGYDPVAYRQPRADPTRAEKAITQVENLRTLQQQLSLDLEFCNTRSAIYANKKRSQEPSLKKGDKVYLLRRHIKTKRPSDKLDFKKFGPFRIAEKISSVNYRLELPKTSKLHPVFHVSLLEPARGNTPVDTNAELQPEHDADVYDVEQILDKRVRQDTTEYLIKWLGWDDIHNTWEPGNNLNCPEKLAEFRSRNPPKPRKKETRTREAPRKKEPYRIPNSERFHWKA